MNANKRLHSERIVTLLAMIHSPSPSGEPQAVMRLALSIMVLFGGDL
jgi:hypothetical protein